MKTTIWRPFTQMKNITKGLDAVSAKDSLIYLSNGKALIDAISSWWLITLGHCHPALVHAVRRQSGTLDQVLFANFTHTPAKKLAQELQSVLPPSLSYLFFSDNGSTAVEVALKMAVQSFQRQKEKRNVFISFKHSYHGDTLGAMSVSGPSLFTKPYNKLLFSVIRVNQGRYSKDPVSAYVDDFEKKINRFEKITAGVIIEPFVQGAGGMIVWPKAALREICRISRKKGIYIIFDEVMTGFGRTGHLFAFQKLGLTPDLLCLSKGLTGGFLPLAVTVANQNIYKSFLSDEKKYMFFHGHSFTGNPLSCSVALAHLREIKKSRWKRHWLRIEHFHKQKIKQLKGHKNLLDARSCGTIAVLEFKLKNIANYSSPFAEELTARAVKKGVFLRPLGNIVYILPPFCISNKELDQVWSFIEEELNHL